MSDSKEVVNAHDGAMTPYDMGEDEIRVLSMLMRGMIVGDVIPTRHKIVGTDIEATVLGIVTPPEVMEDLGIELPEGEVGYRPLVIILEGQAQSGLLPVENASSPEMAAAAQEKFEARLAARQAEREASDALFAEAFAAGGNEVEG